MKITITDITPDGKYMPIKLDAERVLAELHRDYEFYLHANIDDNMWLYTISELTTGASVSYGMSREQAIKNAKFKLSTTSAEDFDKLIRQAKETIQKAKQAEL